MVQRLLLAGKMLYCAITQYHQFVIKRVEVTEKHTETLIQVAAAPEAAHPDTMVLLWLHLIKCASQT